MRRVLIIPAAGTGSRLKSRDPKALVVVNGRPMVDHLLALFAPFVTSAVVVAHPSFSERMRTHVAQRRALSVTVAEQPQPTGMLDAILAAAPLADATADRIWIVWCDQVGVLPETLARIDAAERTSRPALLVPTVLRQDPYIHFDRDAEGRIRRVLQRRELDAMPAEGESDMGVFALSGDAYHRRLPAFGSEVTPGTGTRERNFLPFIPWLAARDTVVTVPCTDPREAVGINTPEELRAVENWLQTRFLTP